MFGKELEGWEKEHPIAAMQSDIATFEHMQDALEKEAQTSKLKASWAREGREAQVEMLRNAFAKFDADSDGKLTEEEVVGALTRKTGQGTEFSEEAARATWKRWQADFDFDNDGTISIEELKMREDFLWDHRHDGE